MKEIIENFDFNELGIDDTSRNVILKTVLDKKTLDNLIRWCVLHVFPCDAYDQLIFEWIYDSEGLPDYISVYSQSGYDDYYIIGQDVTSLPCPLLFEADYRKGTVETLHTGDGQSFEVYTKATEVSLNLEGTNMENLDGIMNKTFNELTTPPKMKSFESLKDLKIKTLIIQENDVVTDLTSIPKIGFRLYLMNNKNLTSLKGLRHDIPYVMITRKQPVYKNITDDTTSDFLLHYSIFDEPKTLPEELFEIKNIVKKGNTLIFSAKDDSPKPVDEAMDFNGIKDDKPDMVDVIYKNTIEDDFHKLNDTLLEMFRKEYDKYVNSCFSPKTKTYTYRYNSSMGEVFLECTLEKDNTTSIKFKNRVPRIKRWISDTEHLYCGAVDDDLRWPVDVMKVLKTFSNLQKQHQALVYKLFSILGGSVNCNVNKKNKKLLSLFDKFYIPCLTPGTIEGAYEERLIPEIYFKFNIVKNPYAKRRTSVWESLDFSNVNVETDDTVDIIKKSVDPDQIYNDYVKKLVEFLNNNNTINENGSFKVKQDWMEHDVIYFDKTPNRSPEVISYGSLEICDFSYRRKDPIGVFIRFKQIPKIKRWIVSSNYGFTGCIDFIAVVNDLYNIRYNVLNGPLMLLSSVAVDGNENQLWVNVRNEQDIETLETKCKNFALPKIRHKNININKKLVSPKYNLRWLYKLLKIDNNPFDKLSEGFDFNRVKIEQDTAVKVFEHDYKCSMLPKIFEKLKPIFKQVIRVPFSYAYSTKDNTMYIATEKYGDADLDVYNKTRQLEPERAKAYYKRYFYTIQFNDLAGDNIEIEKFFIPNRLLDSSDINLYKVLKPVFQISQLYRISQVVLNYAHHGNDTTDETLYAMFNGNVTNPWSDREEYLTNAIDSNLFDNIGQITSTKKLSVNVACLLFRGSNPEDSLASFDKFCDVFDRTIIELYPSAAIGLKSFGVNDFTEGTMKLLKRRMTNPPKKYKKYGVNEDLDFNNVIEQDNTEQLFYEHVQLALYDEIFEKVKKCFGGITMYYFYSLKENTMYLTRYRWMHKLNKDLHESDEPPYATANLGRFGIKNVMKPQSEGEESLYAINAILKFNDFMHEGKIVIDKAYLVMYVITPIMYKPLMTALEISGAYKINELYMCWFCTAGYVKMWGSEAAGRLHGGELPVMNNNIGIIKSNKPFNFDIDYLEFDGKSYDDAINKFRLFIEMFDKQCYDIRLRGYKEIIIKVKGKKIGLIPSEQAEQIIANYYNIDKTP